MLGSARAFRCTCSRFQACAQHCVRKSMYAKVKLNSNWYTRQAPQHLVYHVVAVLLGVHLVYQAVEAGSTSWSTCRCRSSVWCGGCIWYTRLWRQAPQHLVYHVVAVWRCSNSCTIGPFSSRQFSAAAIHCYCLRLSSSYRNIPTWGYVMVSFEAGSTAWGAPKTRRWRCAALCYLLSHYIHFIYSSILHIYTHVHLYGFFMLRAISRCLHSARAWSVFVHITARARLTPNCLARARLALSSFEIFVLAIVQLK